MDDLNPNQIKQMIAMLQSMLPQDQSDEPEANSVIRSKNIDTKKKRVNKFEQMSEYTMHKDDVAIDQALSKYPPVARNRSYTPLKVVCRVCGRTETVNPAMIDSVERYKCNKCSAMAG